MIKIFKVLCLVLSCLILMPFTVLARDDDYIDLIPNAKSGMLIEASTGKVLFEKNIDDQVAVASMTKMVAQIIILENIESGKIKWTDVITVSKNAADMGGSQIYISEGEKITVEDLMKGISMASGNDATVAMAEVISGSEEKFVKLMNKKVRELGLKNTYFKNCTGLDEDGHYSSAYDMAMIARELVNNHPEILKFSSLYEDYLREDTDNKFWLVNTNKLIRFYDGADGLKTGFTDAAGYCLAATAKRNGLRLIAVVLGEKEGSVRNNETIALLDYGYSNIKMNILRKKGEVVKKLKLEKADTDFVDVVLKDDLGVVELLDREKHKYTYKVNLKKFKIPLKKDQVIGEIIVEENKKNISKVDLIVSNDVNKLSFVDLFLNSLRGIFSGSI